MTIREQQLGWLDDYQFPVDMKLVEVLDQFAREFHLAPEDARQIIIEWLEGK